MGVHICSLCCDANNSLFFLQKPEDTDMTLFYARAQATQNENDDHGVKKR